MTAQPKPTRELGSFRFALSALAAAALFAVTIAADEIRWQLSRLATPR